MFECLPLNCARHRRRFTHAKHLLTLSFECCKHCVLMCDCFMQRRQKWRATLIFSCSVATASPLHFPLSASPPVRRSLGPPLGVGLNPSLYVCDRTAVPLLLISTYNQAAAVCMGMIRGFLDSLQQRELLNPR